MHWNEQPVQNALYKHTESTRVSWNERCITCLLQACFNIILLHQLSGTHLQSSITLASKVTSTEIYFTNMFRLNCLLLVSCCSFGPS